MDWVHANRAFSLFLFRAYSNIPVEWEGEKGGELVFAEQDCAGLDLGSIVTLMMSQDVGVTTCCTCCVTDVPQAHPTGFQRLPSGLGE